MSMPVRWSLPDDHSAARLARRHVGNELAAWPQVEDIELVASELTTNAVEHGRAPIELDLELVEGRLRVSVSNRGDDREPRLIDAADDSADGRGLTITRALADDWGWAREEDRLRVWADFTPSN